MSALAPAGANHPAGVLERLVVNGVPVLVEIVDELPEFRCWINGVGLLGANAKQGLRQLGNDQLHVSVPQSVEGVFDSGFRVVRMLLVGDEPEMLHEMWVVENEGAVRERTYARSPA